MLRRLPKLTSGNNSSGGGSSSSSKKKSRRSLRYHSLNNNKNNSDNNNNNKEDYDVSFAAASASSIASSSCSIASSIILETEHDDDNNDDHNDQAATAAAPIKNSIGITSSQEQKEEASTTITEKPHDVSSSRTTENSNTNTSALMNLFVHDNDDNQNCDEKNNVQNINPNNDNTSCNINSNHNNNNNQQQQQQEQEDDDRTIITKLENRVEELEMKLAVLSRLLQQPKMKTSTTNTMNTTVSPRPATPPLPPPPASPILHNDNDNNDFTIQQPHLESPAPILRRKIVSSNNNNNYNNIEDENDQQNLDKNYIDYDDENDDSNNNDDDNHEEETTTTTTSVPPTSLKNRNRNLSLTLLFEGDEVAYRKHRSNNAPPINSMTLSERRWLQPQILQLLDKKNNNIDYSTSNNNSNDSNNNINDNTIATQNINIREDGQQGSNNPQQQQETDDKEIHPLKRQVQKQQSLSPQHIHRPKVAFADKTDNKNNDGTAAAATSTISINDNSINNNNNDSNDDDDNTTSTSSTSIIMKKQQKVLRTKWLEYLNSFQESTPDVDAQMEEFIKVPAGVEAIMAFGLFVCLDTFIYMFTVLPIRFIWSCLLLFIKIINQCCQYYGIFNNNNNKQSSSSSSSSSNPHFQFHRRHLYQLIQVFSLILIYQFVLVPISIGKLYHWIRGQAMIKLYVIIAMVEIFDRLFSSLGQDCLDSMYWNTVSRPRSSRFIVSIIVVIVYAAIHALILFVHAATLNVALNSDDQALLTLLISGNFAEIKSTVFKKYNKAALFKITASDICERFKLFLFLSLVLLLNLCQGMEQRQFFNYMHICGVIWIAELIADWIKHAFITKFNFLPARVYREYLLLLAGDVTGFGHEGVSLDNSHAVVKRIGFAQIPLVCVMFRLLKEAIKYARNQGILDYWLPVSTTQRIIIYITIWLFFLIQKLLLGYTLERFSIHKLYNAPEYSQLTPFGGKLNNNNTKKIKTQ